MQSLQRGFIGRIIVTIFLGVIFFSVLYKAYLAPPAAFPTPYVLTVSEGENIADISKQLTDEGAIKSPLAFRIFVRLLGDDKHISEGQYTFDQPLSSLALALRISGKEFGISKQKITFPEGYTNADIARHLKEVFPEFDATQFVALTNGKQGYLFPDTYSFFGTPLPSSVVADITQNYEKKVRPLRDSIAQSGHSEAEIIVMASIIEKEAHGANDRAIIAGILWNRIRSGMALQVDAAPTTYKIKGLPSNPISNPGLATIKAAISPTPSNYVYYLHDSFGNIHYASTYKEHEQNIKTYLK
ncbi:MAG: aminodeoxychorismate lyase, protein [Candidatus Nomurabacteria bacterium]|nr:aminodeoxychorismate lyase, protein [Candidatus Nomurabacteria bacterium]